MGLWWGWLARLVARDHKFATLPIISAEAVIRVGKAMVMVDKGCQS